MTERLLEYYFQEVFFIVKIINKTIQRNNYTYQFCQMVLFLFKISKKFNNTT